MDQLSGSGQFQQSSCAGEQRTICPAQLTEQLRGSLEPTAVNGPGLMHRATSLIRVIRRQAEDGNQLYEANGRSDPSETDVATPKPAGMLMQPRDSRSMVDAPLGVTYMRQC